MTITRVARGCYVLALMLFAQTFAAASSDIADAAMNRNKDAVRSLLQKKVDVNSTQVDGTTALHWAVRADDLETADLLIRAGANVSVANRDGVTPMQLAAVNGTAPMIEKLIKAGANPNASLSKFADTALMLAARTGKVDPVKVLLDNGAQVNAIETWGGTTALMWAVSERHLDTVKMLIAHGADANVQRDGKPVLIEAVRGGEEMLILLLEHEADINAVTVDPNGRGGPGETALMKAVSLHDKELVRYLIAAGADVSIRNTAGDSALDLAEEEKEKGRIDPEIVRMLREAAGRQGKE